MEKILISCVAENREQDFQKVFNLMLTLRELGGKLSDSPVIVNFVEGCQANYQSILHQLGVKVRIVDRYDQRCPHANKLRMLDLADDFNFTLLLALDIDTVIANDFTIFLSGDLLSAKIVDGTPFTIEQWQAIFAYFGLPLPEQRYYTTTTYVPVIPYFNSGVLIIPVKVLAILSKYWTDYVKLLLDLLELEAKPIPTHPFFVDQIALSLALTAANLPVRPLPVAMNFPTHVEIAPPFNPRQIEPYILHYHHRITGQGLLQQCFYPKANQVIAKINQRIVQRKQTKGYVI